MDLPDLQTIIEKHERTKRLIEISNDVEYARGVFAIPKEDRSDNFTVGTLATPSCFALSPALAVSHSQKTVVAAYYIGPGLTGHKGSTHGGVIATIMDECCGRAALCHFNHPSSEGVEHVTEAMDSVMPSGGPSRHRPAVTARLAINFVAPVKTGSTIIIEAVVAENELSQRKAQVQARLWTLEGVKNVLAASAESLFITPKIT